MQITFISFDRFLITGMLIALSLMIYFWFVRPRLRAMLGLADFYAVSDSKRQAVFDWLRSRWDISVAVAMGLLPIVWNGGLDLIIAVSLVVADLAPALAGLDLSGAVMPAWLKTTIQIAGVLAPIIRARLLKKDE